MVAACSYLMIPCFRLLQILFVLSVYLYIRGDIAGPATAVVAGAVLAYCIGDYCTLLRMHAREAATSAWTDLQEWSNRKK